MPTPRIKCSEAIFQKVNANSTEYKTVCTPANGELIGVYKFRANGADPNAYVYLVWDRGGGEEKYLASTKGDVELIFDVSLPTNQFTGDGSKELEIIIENNTSEQTPVIGGEAEVIDLA